MGKIQKDRVNMWIKFRNFLVEFAFLFVSLIINTLVLMPLLIYLSGTYREGGIASGYGIGSLFLAIMAPILGFALNELFLRLKGKKTAEYYEVDYLNVDVEVRETWGGYNIRTSSYVSTGERKELTFWGILARILAVIAFPLRVVAFIVSYIALFCPALYSTFGEIDPDMPQRFGSKLTHVLFDFVIVPVDGYASRNLSPLCILWVVIYLVVGPVFAAGGVFAAAYALNKAPGAAVIPLLVIGFFLTLSTLVLTLKYCIVICLDYHTKTAVIYMIRVMIMPVILIALSLTVYFLPWASWGFAVP